VVFFVCFTTTHFVSCPAAPHFLIRDLELTVQTTGRMAPLTISLKLKPMLPRNAYVKHANAKRKWISNSSSTARNTLSSTTHGLSLVRLVRAIEAVSPVLQAVPVAPACTRSKSIKTFTERWDGALVRCKTRASSISPARATGVETSVQGGFRVRTRKDNSPRRVSTPDQQLPLSPVPPWSEGDLGYPSRMFDLALLPETSRLTDPVPWLPVPLPSSSSRYFSPLWVSLRSSSRTFHHAFVHHHLQ
jgi:hypothetical protein